MYPTLYHAFHDLLGLDLQILKLINTFGFFVALAFLGAAKCLASELDRKYQLGLLPATRKRNEPVRQTTPLDLLISGLLAFVIGYKIGGIAFGNLGLQGGSDTQRYLLSRQGHLVAGLVTGFGWMAFRYREMKAARTVPEPLEEPEFYELTPREHTMGITGAAALGGLVGAKVFHFLERPSSIVEFFENPSLSALFSGLTIYGGLIVGTLAVYMYSRRHNLRFAHVADSVAPGLMLAYGIGRLGCHFSGDGDWGIASTAPPPGWIAWLPDAFWSYDYPNNVLGSGVKMATGGYPGYGTHLQPPVFPTPLYESLAAVALFGVLWAARTRIERPLVLFGLYMLLNGIERFWIERIRVNATYQLFGYEVTQAQIISVLMFVGGAALMIVQHRREAPIAPAGGGAAGGSSGAAGGTAGGAAAPPA